MDLLDIHRPENLANHIMRIRGIAFAHIPDGVGEQVRALKNVGIFGEEAENQAGHEVVHFMTFIRLFPIGVFLQQFQIQPVQAAGGADVKGTFTDLLDRGNPGQRQEETEMVGKVRIITNHGRIIRFQILGLEVKAIGGQDNAPCRASWPGYFSGRRGFD